MERIQKYLHGELSAKERREFEAELAQDSDLSEELDAAKAIMAQFNLDKKKHWQQLLEQQEEKPVAIIKPLRTRRLQIIGSVAALIILGLVGLFSYRYFAATASLESQIASYIGERHLSPSTIMGEASTELLWREAKQAYSKEDWEGSISAIENIQKNTPLTAEQHFYLGLSYLYKTPGDYNKAINHFQQSRQLGISQYGQQADWYESLALSAKKDITRAKVLLERIVNNQQWQMEEAKKLLNNLN